MAERQLPETPMTDDNHTGRHWSLRDIVKSHARDQLNVEKISHDAQRVLAQTAETPVKFLIEPEKVNKPGALLDQIETEHHPDVDTAVVVPDRRDARHVTNLLRRPVAETADWGSRLFATTRPLTIDGNRVVYPKNESTDLEWCHRPLNPVELHFGDTVIATVEQPTDLESIDLPRVVENGDEVAVCDPDGTVLAVYESLTDLRDEWGVVTQPYRPEHWLYPHIKVLYVDGTDGDLIEYQPSEAHNLKSTQAIVKEVLENQTIVTPDAELPLWRVIERVQTYGRRHTGQTPRSSTILPAISQSVELETRTSSNSPSEVVLLSRTWRYPITDR